LDVSAQDMGDPQLSSSIAVHVRVKHANPTTSDGGLGFADDTYTVELREDAPAGQLVKTLTILNVRAHPQAPLECRITAGDEQGIRL
jgi:protocadherin-15